MLYHERERKNKENFVYIVYLLTRLCNIFDEAFFLLTSVYIKVGKKGVYNKRTCYPDAFGALNCGVYPISIGFRLIAKPEESKSIPHELHRLATCQFAKHHLSATMVF